jgi:hypothetical protein
MVERLQALAVINGFTAHLHPEPRGKNPLYVLSISPKAWRSVGGHGKDRTQLERNPATDERVWCVETETGTIVTRRRGKVTVMGNCQNIGRGLRPAPGKDDLLILDHSDTHLRLGFVSDIEHIDLHTGREAAAAPKSVRLPKECPECGYLKKYGVMQCPNCGHVTPPPPVAKEYTEGELQEYNGKRSRGVKENFTMAEKAIFLAELKTYCAQHGYKPGWAARKYLDRFGVWPDWSIKNVPPAAVISGATANWIKSQNIAWAKSKRRLGAALQSKQGAPVNHENVISATTAGNLSAEDRDWAADHGLG